MLKLTTRAEGQWRLVASGIPIRQFQKILRPLSRYKAPFQNIDTEDITTSVDRRDPTSANLEPNVAFRLYDLRRKTYISRMTDEHTSSLLQDSTQYRRHRVL